MALKIKDELVGKRFICFEKSSQSILQSFGETNDIENGMKFENLSARRGVIRATTSKDVNEESHQILVEYDNQPWETREWLTTADQLCLLLVEDSLAWMSKGECSGQEENQDEDGEKSSNSHLPVLIFKQVYGDIKVKDNFAIEILKSRKLLFYVDPAFLRPFKEEDLKDLKPALSEDAEATREAEKWWNVQNGQNILLNMPLILVGFRVQVYRTEGATQWFTAVIRMVDENSQTLIILDDTVLEEHHVSPSLVQMFLIGEGVVSSLLNGDHIKIRPSRTKISTSAKNFSAGGEKKRKKSVVKDHPKKRKTKSPTGCIKLETSCTETEVANREIAVFSSIQQEEKNKIASPKSDLKGSTEDFKACNKGENHNRSLFKPRVKQKPSSPSASSLSSSSSSFFSSSSSSSSSESGDGSCQRPNGKVISTRRTSLALPSKSINNIINRLKLPADNQHLASDLSSITNNSRAAKRSPFNKLEKNKKSSKEKGVIFLTEEEEELNYNTPCIEKKDKKTEPKSTLKPGIVMNTSMSNKTTFMDKAEVMNEHDKPVDLSSTTSLESRSTESQRNVPPKKVHPLQSSTMSDHQAQTYTRPVQTVFPTINCQDRSDQNSGLIKIQTSDNPNHQLTYNLINQSARNLIPLGYIPFLPLINSSMKVVANPLLDQHKSGTSMTIPCPQPEQVAALVENTRLLQQLQACSDEIYQSPSTKSSKNNFHAVHELGLSSKEEVAAFIREEKNAQVKRRESKFVVHEPERPGEAVNHHFNKSLVRHPFGVQPSLVPGVMLTLASQMHAQPPSILNKSSSSSSSTTTTSSSSLLSSSSTSLSFNHSHAAIFTPQLKPNHSSRVITSSMQNMNMDSCPTYTAPKSALCTPNMSFLPNTSVDSLKPTLDLSGNVYLPTVSMLKASPDAFLSRLQQQDQVQEYLKLHAQQFNHSTQNHLVLSVAAQSKQMTQNSNNNNKDVLETPTSSLLLFSNKVSTNQSATRADPVHSKAEGVLDLQKKQAHPLMIATSKSSHAPPISLHQLWSDKLAMQDQQALLSNSIIVLDCHSLKGIDQSVVGRLTSNSSGNYSINRNPVMNSMQTEAPLANGKKRTWEEALPLLNPKKLRVTDRLMDVTSLLFCSPEMKACSPQLSFLTQSSTLNGNRLQNCIRVETPEVPSVSFTSVVEGRPVPKTDDDGAFKQGNVKSEGESNLDCLGMAGHSKFLNNKSSYEEAIPFPNAFTSCTTSIIDATTRGPRTEPSMNSVCMGEECLSIALSSTSTKCISSSSPESSRDHLIGTDSETRSACSPLTTRSIGGTPTFTSSSLEVNDSSPAIPSWSACSSGVPVKFKKAWLKRYDEDSRNDSLSSSENISSSSSSSSSANARPSKSGANDINPIDVKSDIAVSKSFDIRHDIMTPSTSAVEDSNEAWTSENDADDGKSVESHQSKKDLPEREGCTKEKLKNGRFECLEKMKGRLRELRVLSRRDDPSAILSSQVLNHVSKEKRSETLEPFLQDGSCHEVTPRLIKCRECRAIKSKKERKAPNDFCRFYAFRRLRYVSKRHLSVSGFSDLSDVTIPDVELWFPTLPIVGPALDHRVASYLLIHLREPFSKIAKVERMAETWCNESISGDVEKANAVWKRAVQGVKEMCDVCDVALFNIHCVCNKCGFAVCISCHKEKVHQMRKMKMMMMAASSSSADSEKQPKSPSEDGTKAKKSKNDKQNEHNGVKSCSEEPSDRWLTCHNKQQPHDPLKLMVAQTIPSDVLWYLEELLEKYFKNQTSLPNNNANSLPFLSSAFDRLAVLADVAEKQIPQDENQMEMSKQSLRPQNSPFVGLRKFHESNSSSAGEVLGPISAGTKFQGKCISMLQKERLLHVTDSSAAESNHFLRNFQDHWSKGLPVVVSKCNLDIDLWRPDHLYRTLTRSDPNHFEAFVDSVACRRFWEGFEKVSARAKHDRRGLTPSAAASASGCEMLSPVFTWGSSRDEFRDMLPNQFQNFMESLPLCPYTSDNGRYNLTSRLPEFFAKPDLGPRLHVGYGQLDMFEGSLPLKLEGCDVISLLACVVTPKDDVNNHLSAAEKYLMKIGCGLKLSDTATKPGIVWHLFDRQSNDIIEKIIVEKQMKMSKPTLSKTPVYLTLDDMKLLKKEHNVEPITIVQHLDDAVFIPAGCYHQARFLHGCVMASMDVVTPENTSFMLNHQLEVNFSCSDKLQLLNTIYHATKDSLAVMMQSEMLSHCH